MFALASPNHCGVLNKQGTDMIVTIGSTKGGVGKSTLAVQAAITRAIEGRRVWLIDADRQGTSYLAMQARAQAGHLPLMACDHLHDWRELEAQIEAKAAGFDDVLIDVGGYDNAAFRVALVLSDRLVIPTAPRAYDFWALDDVQAVIQLVRPKNPRLQVRVMLSCADTTGSDNAAAMAALQQFDGIEYQATPVTRRKSIAKAAGMGLSVLETKPKDKKAIYEVRGFTSALFAL